jgi:polyhydroxybutyrate depolymerase
VKSSFNRFVFLLPAAAIVIFCAPSAKKNAAFFPAATAPISPGDSEHTLSIDNRKRSYLLHVPPGFSAAEPAAPVFVFHGFSEDGGYIREVTGVSDIADAHGFLVVYPNGTVCPGPLSWNAGGCCGYASENQIDEPAFIRAILADLGQILSVDPKRIYAAGFSNRALLFYRSACEVADTFAAVAPVAGLLPIRAYQPQESISLLHVHGSGDVAVPIHGGGINPSSGLPFLSVNRCIAAWV